MRAAGLASTHVEVIPLSAPPLILCVAPNGARRTKRDHPGIPLEPEELARDAVRCVEAGAAMLHLHIRDRDGAHSLDAGLYAEALAALRAAVGPSPIVQITTEAVGRFLPAQQMDVVRRVRPEAFSVAVRELLPEARPAYQAAEFLLEQAGRGVSIQYILYDAADVRRFNALREDAVIPEAGAAVLFVLGRYSAQQPSDPAELVPQLAAWRGGMPWMVCAFGRREAECGAAAARAGGHVRVGFENNLHLPDGQLARENADLVRAAARAVARTGRSLATPAAARRILGMRAPA